MTEEQTRAPESAHWESNGKDKGNGGGGLAESVPPAKVQPVPPGSSLSRSDQPSFEPVLDSEEAAGLLHIHPKTLQRLARNGDIPGFRIGKLWGFRASVLNEWLESKASS